MSDPVELPVVPVVNVTNITNEPTHPRKPSEDELRDRFVHNPISNPELLAAHIHASSKCLGLARWIRDTCPAGRNLDLALDHLEDVRTRVNAALARDSVDPRPDGEACPDAQRHGEVHQAPRGYK